MTRAATQTRQTDAKGRLSLGDGFVNRTVLVQETGEGEVTVRLARVIPEKEAWLYENPAALGAVRKGLSQARAKKFVKGPDLPAAARLARDLEGS